jgi:hypothetical protein
VPIAAGVLYPAYGLVLSPMIAALAMSFSSASVVGNALRLRKARRQCVTWAVATPSVDNASDSPLAGERSVSCEADPGRPHP